MSRRTAGIYDFDVIRANIDRLRKEENVINPGGPNSIGTVSGVDISTSDTPVNDGPPPAYY